MLWRREKFPRICSNEDLVEKVQDMEVTIPVKQSQEILHNSIQGGFFVNRFPSWGRRQDGVAINEALQIVHIQEFKRSIDKDLWFLEVKRAEIKEQHNSIICALRAAAQE